MLKEVMEYNKINGLKLVSKTEIATYAKQVRKFFDGNSTADRINSLVDCEYVRFGTQIKMAYNGVTELPYDKSVEQIMVSILLEEIPKSIFDTVIRQAEKIVCTDNANDSTSDTSAEIQSMLQVELAKYDTANQKLMDMN